jgi:hypothetical protein
LDRTVFQMPSPMRVTGRTSSITNAFVSSIIPSAVPTDEEIIEALAILGMTPDTIECAYCGDPSTEWDHLRPIVRRKKPTGYISEIGNLVPACGKCNQSKGNKDWRDWMLSEARLSPRSKAVANLDERIARLEAYEEWKPRDPIDFESIIGAEDWRRHWQNHDNVVTLMRQSQGHADRIKAAIEESGAI